MLYERGEGLPPTRFGSSIRIDGEAVPRWQPGLVVAEGVRPSPALDVLGYRGPAKYQAPDILFSDPQPLMIRGGSFAVLAERQGIVPGSTYLHGEYDWQAMFSATERFDLPADRPVLVAANCVATSYYHWVFQCLAPVLIGQEHGLAPDFVVLVPTLPATLRESLSLAGIGPERIIELPAAAAAVTAAGIHTNLTSGEFAFAPHPAIAAAIAKLAERVPRSPLAGRRIFISRADAAKRRMVNEEELAEALRALDFEVVLCGDLRFAEQVALFRDAALIVAQHGAALTNLLFAADGDDGPQVIELHQDNYINQAYVKLCQVKRLRYGALVNPMVEPGPDGRHGSNWRTDIAALLTLLTKL